MSDLVEKLTKVADAATYDDGSDTPLAEQIRAGATEIKRLREALKGAAIITNTTGAELDRLQHIASEAVTERDRLREQFVKCRAAGNQALRQWKMYADMMDGDDDFSSSPEGELYRSCKADLTDDLHGEQK